MHDVLYGEAQNGHWKEEIAWKDNKPAKLTGFYYDDKELPADGKIIAYTLKEIAQVDFVRSDNAVSLLGGAAGGAAGGLLLGPIGAIGGMLAGGRSSEAVAKVTLCDGAWFIVKMHTGTVELLQGAAYENQRSPQHSNASATNGLRECDLRYITRPDLYQLEQLNRETTNDIHFSCPGCEGSLVVTAEGAGFVVNCPHCNTELTIPSSNKQLKSSRIIRFSQVHYDSPASVEARKRHALENQRFARQFGVGCLAVILLTIVLGMVVPGC